MPPVFAKGPSHPGEILSIFGPGIGPAEPAFAVPQNGRLPTALLNTSVDIDGIAAPLLYIAENQINAVAPFGIAGATSADVRIHKQSFDIDPVVLPVAAAAPGGFTLDGSGGGQVAAVNQDGTINGPDHPAPQGSIVSLYFAGFGQMQPSVEDGAIALGPGSKPLLQPVAYIRLNPSPVEVLYCGDAPGSVEGAIQMNIRIPQIPSAGQAQLYLNLGDVSLANKLLLAISVKWAQAGTTSTRARPRCALMCST